MDLLISLTEMSGQETEETGGEVAGARASRGSCTGLRSIRAPKGPTAVATTLETSVPTDAGAWELELERRKCR